MIQKAARLARRTRIRALAQVGATTRRDAQGRTDGLLVVGIADVDDAEQVQAAKPDAARDLFGQERLESGALRPAFDEPPHPGRARIRTNVSGDRLPRHPAAVRQLL